MHIKVKALILSFVQEKNKSGDPNYLPLSMKERLRQTVGEVYWKKAQDYLDHFLKLKKLKMLDKAEAEIQQHEKKKKHDQQSQDLVRREEIAIAKVRALKDEEIAKLKASKDEEIAKLWKEIQSMVDDLFGMNNHLASKDKEIATLKESLKRRQSDLLKQYTINGFVLEENKKLKNELADVQKKVATIRQEKDTTVANKDQQLKSVLQELTKKDEDIAKKNEQLQQLASIKMILNPVTDDEGEPANKRARISTSDTSMEIWDKDPPRRMTRHQNQILNRAREKPIVKFENKVEGFKRCPFPGCNTIGLFTKGCSIVTCRMNMRHNGKFHHFCFYCGKTASDPGDSCNNGVCPYKIDEESRKLYQDNLDQAFKEFSEQTRQAGGAYDVDKV